MSATGPLNFGTYRAPAGFVYPSAERQQRSRYGRRKPIRKFRRPLFPIDLRDSRRNYKIIIDYKAHILAADGAITRAMGNFNRGTSLFQRLSARAWNRATNYAPNPNWAGRDYPPITMIIDEIGFGRAVITCSCNEKIPVHSLRQGIVRECNAEAQPWDIINSVTIIRPTTKTERYASFRGMDTL